MPDNDHIINCSDDKSEQIFLEDGDFKKIKNFDPSDNYFEYAGLNSSDAIICGVKDGRNARWFSDKESGNTYVFITDKNDKIIAGAIVEYSGSHSRSGVQITRMSTDKMPEASLKLDNAEYYQGDSKDKEEIKAYLKQKIKDSTGGLEVTQNVSKSDLLNAASGLASADVTKGGAFKSTGASDGKGSNEIC